MRIRVRTLFKREGPNCEKKELHVLTFLKTMLQWLEQRNESISLTQQMSADNSRS